ncbi:IclR family transcriptional regulator [Salinibacterium hongtaonis]|uniref:IclR family transcriptional regulator n=1 Tax=Homoserinimonas hongtaonis TaxID=2079791 RepID=A0A2U1T163_9MICO|nr:IclR family transcriptional regulator [Salinibacterium hongtaonis]AWB90158.1 IclR family transcriptional regulator [Salinibacterium hongtaonis]PWB97598.1 IclR family transcriptional regulator [Salinibacterium hongtaonis]
MSTAVPRAFSVLELLVTSPSGLPLGKIAEELAIPPSATHRIVTELVDLGYLRSDSEGNYALGLQLVSQALRHLASIPLVELARPTLDQLAELSGELVRLSIPDGDHLVWVAKSQGARGGLRYDPDAGREARFARTSSGLAWLSALPEDQAIARLQAQGFERDDDSRSSGPRDLDEALAAVREARERGFAFTDSTHELGIAAVAVPVSRADGTPAAVLSIAGPSVRLTRERALELVPHLFRGREDLAVLADSTLHA